MCKQLTACRTGHAYIVNMSLHSTGCYRDQFCVYYEPDVDRASLLSTSIYNQMCGIVGFATHNPVTKKVVAGLKTLEYRGYDSAGVAFIQNNQIITRRAVGKLNNLVSELEHEPLDANTAIGHTRWATHGGATLNNAHPHVSRSVVVVHNGIIENFAELKDWLIERGFQFRSETDTEVISHLIQYELDTIEKGLQASGAGITSQHRLSALSTSLRQLHGSYAILVQFQDAPNELYASCYNSPLSLGFKSHQMPGQIMQNEYFLASDQLAFAQHCEFVYQMQNNQIVQIIQTTDGDIYSITDVFMQPSSDVVLEQNHLNEQQIVKGRYPHFMLKEICEQHKAVFSTYQNMLNQFKDHRIAQLMNQLTSSKITLIACGTSYHACLLAKYLFEKYAKIPCQTELASEFLYRDPVISGFYCFVSQSGETRDTIAAMDMVKAVQGVQTMVIVNVPTSCLARKADYTFVTQAGPEIGVASTKAFTCQLMVYIMLVSELMIENQSIKQELRNQVLKASLELDQFIEFQSPSLQHLAEQLTKYKSISYIGRGISYPLALEGALKFKEICYIHAEGYAAGELKHGPIALVDEHMPVVVSVFSENFEKTVSNIQEITARGGKCIIVINKELHQKFISVYDSRHTSCLNSPGLDGALQQLEFVVTPQYGSIGEIFSHAAALQLLAYYAACALGVDVDQPRNLAKCVTVE